MKSLIWMPLALVLAAGLAVLIVRAATGSPHLRETAVAAIIVALASEIALIPLVLTRRASQIAVSQAALAGTVLHMFLAFVLGAVAYSLHLVGSRNIFLFVLLAFYWISLVLIVVAMIRGVRRASPQGPGAVAGAASK